MVNIQNQGHVAVAANHGLDAGLDKRQKRPCGAHEARARTGWLRRLAPRRFLGRMTPPAERPT
jgi:hypothetical protein